MATTYPLPTLACTISAAGISAPQYSDILASLQASAQLIFGSDVYLQPDSQDGQLLAVFAQAMYDANMATIAAYNSFSPATAVGVGLSNAVRINNIKRAVATNSQVNLTVAGVAGTTISGGQAGDASGNVWNLPATVTIPSGGSVVVTATAAQPGAVQAPASTVVNILTPTAGWQSVTNASAASPGLPIETDAQLRLRQSISQPLGSKTTSRGIVAAIQAIPGVTYGVLYENDTGTTDANGVPGHSICLVVQGGDATAIANTLYQYKNEGVGTYGSTTVAITDVSGASRNINFTVPTQVPIKVAISLHALTGYTTAVAAEIQAAVAAYINGLVVGASVLVTRLYGPALLNGAMPDGGTFELVTLQAALSPSGTLGTTDIAIAFDHKATCLASNVTITVV